MLATTIHVGGHEPKGPQCFTGRAVMFRFLGAPPGSITTGTMPKITLGFSDAKHRK